MAVQHLEDEGDVITDVHGRLVHATLVVERDGDAAVQAEHEHAPLERLQGLLVRVV